MTQLCEGPDEIGQVLIAELREDLDCTESNASDELCVVESQIGQGPNAVGTLLRLELVDVIPGCG